MRTWPSTARLVAMLEHRGLPADWKPTHVYSYDYGPCLVVPQKY